MLPVSRYDLCEVVLVLLQRRPRSPGLPPTFQSGQLNQHLGVKRCSTGPVPQRPGGGNSVRTCPATSNCTELYPGLHYSTVAPAAPPHPPGVTVPPQQAALQLGEGEAELPLQADGVLDQLVSVAQVDPAALQVLLHHLLQLPHSLLGEKLQHVN